MNKLEKKILSSALATLCMLEVNGNRKTEALSPTAISLITGLTTAIVMPIAFAAPMIIKYFTQKASDDAAYERVKGSNFSFDSISSERIKKGFEQLAKDYPWAEKQILEIQNKIQGIVKLKKIDPNAAMPVLDIIGNPGCGKTSMVKKIHQILNIPTPITIYLSDMDSQKEKVSVANQLFGTWSSGSPYMELTSYSPLAIALKKNPNNTALLLDDVDKYPSEVVQKLYTVCDGGTLKTGDSWVNTSKLFVIMTGNTDYINIGEHSKEWKESMTRRTIRIDIPDPRKIDYINKMVEVLSDINKTNNGSVSISYDNETLDKIAESYVDNKRNMTNISEFRIRTLGQIEQQLLDKKYKLKLSIGTDNTSCVLPEEQEEITTMIKENTSEEKNSNHELEIPEVVVQR